ncbi:TonB-dependent receptor [SAR86 cluster bacterium]|nr:TonB-dependent receptor [SAR86 cluster bacterium]
MKRNSLLVFLTSFQLIFFNYLNAEDSEEILEEIVIVGKPIKTSQMESIQAKKISDNIVEVISSDDIGRFPDQNIADALGRVPGVSIERDQGRSRFLNFRGAPPRYTAIAFDGIDIPGTENGRIPRFDAYPAVVTSQIFANKAITPDMTGEAVSGYIDIKTFSPSDIEGFSAAFDYGRGEQDLGDGDTERENLRISFSNEKFGILLYNSSAYNEQITTNLDDMDFTLTDSGYIPTSSGSLGIRFNNYLVDYENKANGGSLEYYFDDGNKLFLRSIRTEFEESQQRNSWYLNFGRGADAAGTELTPGTGTSLALVFRLVEDGTYDNSTEIDTLGLDWSIGDWMLDARYSQISMQSKYWLPIPYGAGSTVASYDVTNPFDPRFTLTEPLSSLEIDAIFIFNIYGERETDNDQFKFDLERVNNAGVFKTGYKYDVRDALGGNANDLDFASAAAVDTSSYDQPTNLWMHGDQRNDIGGFYTDNKGLKKALIDAGLKRPGIADLPSNLLETIEETMHSVYAMQTIDTDYGNIIFGARYEDTEFETSGSRLDAEGNMVPQILTKSYSNFLPSFHLNYNLDDDRKLRLSATTGVSRPTYTEARASATIDPTTRSISGGNPGLDPEESWGLDTAYEWYFSEASIFAVNVFYREIDNVIVDSNSTVDGSLYSDVAPQGESWTLSGSDNGSDGELKGFEINLIDRFDRFLEGFFSGFGYELNLASVDSSFTAPNGVSYDLPGTSDFTYNASFFYEDYGLSARLAFRYRDGWLDSTESDVIGSAYYWEEQERLELSLRYDLEEILGYKAIVYADFNNLTDFVDIRNLGDLPNQVESYGSRYVLGFKVNL